jgi:diadenosine tetraphosphate (Ap4A) HIT family hydrolase
VPIVVLREHRVEVTPQEVDYMEKALNLVAEQKYAKKFPKWIFDHHMRQIPDHYHFHVRPLLW